MAKKTNPALIGGFVLGAVVLTIVAVLTWGSRELFERKYRYVCYFPGSVNGLSSGAPVKYRGVEIGVVKDVKVRFRQAPENRRIPVFIEVWAKRLRGLGGREPNEALVEELVQRGVRARLASQSILTGVTYVSLDELPGSPLSFSELPGEGALPEIPTVSSQFDELTDALGSLVTNLSAADFKGMSDSVSNAMTDVSEVAGSRELHAALEELPRLLLGARGLTKSLQADADQAGPMIEEAHAAVTALRATLESTRGVISPQAPLAVNLGVALSDVDKAAVAVRELADFLRRNPHAIVAGTKPRPRP